MTRQTRTFHSHAIGDPINPINQAIIDGFPDVILAAFKSTLKSMGLKPDQQKNPATSIDMQAFVIASYIAMVRIASLEGLLDPQEAQQQVNKHLNRLIRTAVVANEDATPEEMEAIKAKVLSGLEDEESEVAP